MNIDIYFDTATDLLGKVSAYAVYIVSGDKFHKEGHAFKMPVKTLTQVDCAAAVNGVYHLLQLGIADQVKAVTIHTTSSHVEEMINTLKKRAHCDAVVEKFIEYRKLFNCDIRAKKLPKQILPGDAVGFIRTWCGNTAKSQLDIAKELVK